MKNLGILLLCILTTSCFAQNSTTSLFGSFNQPIDITSCYKPTPAIVLHAQPEQILFQSTDGGTTWIDLSKGLPAGTDANAIFAKNGEVYLGTRDGKLYHSIDPQSASWEQQNLEGRSTDGFINGIFTGNSGIYACFLQEGFYRQISGTNNWKPMHENLEDKEVYAAMETTNGTLFVGCSTGIYRSIDEGKTWKQVYSKGWVNALTYSPMGLLANDADGLIRSIDNGDNWNSALPDMAAHYKTSVIDGYLVAIRQTSNPLVTVSDDGGRTWKPMNTGNPADKQIFDLEKMGDYLFSSRQGGISRSNDLGKSWQLLLTPPANNNDNNFKVFELVTSGTTLFALMRQGGC